jgi:hypothetical protein
MATPQKGKPWCTHHKINTHASETCWAIHPELKPAHIKGSSAKSASPAVPAQAGFNSLTAAQQQDAFESWQARQSGWGPSDSYVGQVIELLPEPEIVLAGATTRRSSETLRLRAVQGDMPLSFLPHDSHSTARLRGRGEGQVELEQVTWTDQEELAGEQPVEAPVTVQKEGMPLSFEELPATDPRYQGKPDFEVPVNNVLGDQRAQNGSRMGSSGIEGRSGNPKPTYGLKGVGKARILEPQGTAHREPTLEEGLQGMRDLAPVDWSLEHNNSLSAIGTASLCVNLVGCLRTLKASAEVCCSGTYSMFLNCQVWHQEELSFWNASVLLCVRYASSRKLVDCINALPHGTLNACPV